LRLRGGKEKCELFFLCAVGLFFKGSVCCGRKIGDNLSSGGSSETTKGRETVIMYKERQHYCSHE